MRMAILVALGGLGCGPGGGQLAEDCGDRGTCPTDPSLTTIPPGVTNPGTGAGVGSYLVDVQVSWSDDVAEIEAWVTDPAGAPIDGVGVWMQGEALTESDPGRFEGERPSYERVYDLGIEGPEGPLWATAVGPTLHEVDLGPLPWDPDEDNTITWSPAGAQQARVRSDDSDWQELAGDPGAHTFPAGTLVAGEERIRVHRSNTLELTGGAPGSSFEVSVETEDDVSTTASTLASVFGELRAEGSFQDERATAYVLGWLQPADPDADPPTAFDMLLGFEDRGEWSLDGLEPGAWTLRAYLDLDGSDQGASVPAGPSTGDAYATAAETLAAGDRVELELRMERAW